MTQHVSLLTMYQLAVRHQSHGTRTLASRRITTDSSSQSQSYLPIMVRLAAYGGVSCVLAGYVVFSAFRQRSNFFAAAVYLSKSNACMMVSPEDGAALLVWLVVVNADHVVSLSFRAYADPLEHGRIPHRPIRKSSAKYLLWAASAARSRGTHGLH